MNKPNDSKNRVVPITMTDDDDMLPHYDLDFSKAKPNRFAKRAKVIVGAREGTGQNGGRKPVTEQLVGKRIYLYPRQIKRLQKMDANLSAAIRKLVDLAGK